MLRHRAVDPVAIDAVTSQGLARTHSASLLQIAGVVPGLNSANASTRNEIGIAIRELGSSPGAPSFDSSVSLFADGVYAPRNREFAASMFNIQRFEVIKATQAVRLGKSTSPGSGVIAHSQTMTVAASATAARKTVGQRS